MSAKRSLGASRPLWFIHTLLLSTAIALPAMAQIEEVVVTAQKKTEEVQNVPIAVTAFTGQDLKVEQIDQFKDLQFHAPNVTYTAGNFGGADFAIRGIGVTAVGYDAESGVAINFDEVYLSTPQLTEGSFYDLSGVEVLAGPQSTLYGRGATGGVVNVNIAKPDLEQAMAQVITDAGNYGAWKVQGVVNLPIITDELAVRVSGEWDKRDGFVTNINNGSDVDGLDQYSVRPTLRWQPSDKTTIDITGEFTKEDDTHMRADKQLCTSDPTGVLGCLPNSAGTQPVNAIGTLADIEASQQAIAGFLALPTAEGGFFGLPLAQAQAIGAELGLYNLQTGLTLPPGYVDPSGDRQINTDFTPIWRSQDNFLSAKWQQTLTPWLTSTLIGGYDHNEYFSEESYNNIPGEPFPSSALGSPLNCEVAVGGGSGVGTLGTPDYVPGPPNLNCAAGALLGPLADQGVVQSFAYQAASLGGAPPPQAAAFAAQYAGYYAPYFANVPAVGPGELPISHVGNLGLTGGNYSFTPNQDAFDQSDGASNEYSGELRFATSFGGPFNAMVGLYYLHTHVTGDYYVQSSALDYPGILLGALLGPFIPGCAATGCIYAPTYYHNVGQDTDLTSKAMFGEVYYDLIPDTLQITGGLRYTQDNKFNTGRIILFSDLVPIGSNSEADISTPDIPIKQVFDAWTGRGVLNWTPKLSFTDQTLIYASYSTGYKAGGANPNVEPGNAQGISATYNPENIVSYEVGTKNMLLDNRLQANGDIYYYDYSGLQVSEIVDNTSFNANVDAHVWGAEGNFVWQTTDRLQLTFNVAHEESNIVHTALFDPANPTGGNQNTLLIKDDTISALGGNDCVLYLTGPFAGLPPGYFAPPGGVHALQAAGVPNVAFGSCNPLALAAVSGSGTGFSTSGPDGSTTSGQIVNLDNHALQNAPQLSLGLSGRYVQPLPSDYSLTALVNFHWQAHMWGDVFQDGASHIGAEEVTDASLQLNPPDDVWYAQAYIKNIFGANNVTGEYVSSQTSGLYTNAFYGDPRTYGLEIGVKLE